ncbi:hypothetical protein MMC18_008490 [Xylographa bjoerkii]|nr:hypothetical protein [Xylographa bjoerkii]MCJ1395604.1 hypothetical protein [Xylographa bjoerkii]
MSQPPTANNGDHAETEMSHLTMATTPLTVRPIVPEKVNGLTNGHTNGTAVTSTSKHNSHKESHSETQVTSSESRTSTTKTKSETRVQFSSDQQITVLHETVLSTWAKFIEEFNHVDEHYISSTTISGFLKYIERERLTSMPHRGSRWDKVLKWAEFFALQVSGYSKVVEPFVPDSKDATKLILAACRVLLEIKLGPGNAEALETTFGVFYKLGLSLSFFLRHNKLLSVTENIRREVGQAFNALLMLVRDVGHIYYVRITGMSTIEVVLDFNGVFGRQMDAFYRHKNKITDDMWEYTLASGFTIKVKTMRKWLGLQDRTLQTILSDRLAAKSHRAEYSCEWFQRHLLDFSRSEKKILEITAPAGCGKSVLSGWIVDRLQRPLGKKLYQTLSYNVEADIPSETSSLAIVKNLLLQLLESNVGDKALYAALVKAYEMASKPKEVKGLEEALWVALTTGLKDFVDKSDDLMIIVDGLDEIKGGKDGESAIRTRLEQLALENIHVRTVLFSKNATPSSSTSQVQELQITADHTHNDIHHMIERALRNYPHFQVQEEHDREKIVERLVHAAKGNFLWASLTTASLRQESSHNGFQKAVEAVKDAPLTLKKTIEKLFNALDFTKSDAKLLLSLLVVAERPLTVSELKCLLQVDPARASYVERKTDINQDIKHAGGSLIIIQNGVVRFRHSAIRSYLMEMPADDQKKSNYETSEKDLVNRVLAYCKFILTKKYEVTFQSVDMAEVKELFNKHPLLDYAIRNWTVHFRRSSYFKAGGTIEISDELKGIFPSSTHLALLEWACWEPQASAIEAINMHDLALRIREKVFTEKHESVLQSLIICGNLHKKLSSTTQAGTCYYRAASIGQTILSKYSNITITCTTTFLTVTESVTTTTRTEFVSRKEEMLKYIIVACKHQYGKTSDIVIRYYKVLAQLYVDIHEEHEAEIIWRELREIIIVRHGKGSEEETNISEQLTIVLKKGGKQEEVIEYERGIFETTMELEVWDVRRIKITLELAVSYEARNDYLMAEELYVVLWERMVKHCHHDHHHHGVEIHVSMIDIALEYVRFLRRRGRHEEASSVLICIWAEYEEYDFESEVIFLRLKVVGELMRAVSLLSIAISVFKKCWSWFSSHGKHEHVASCEVLISSTVEEIITTTSTTAVSTTTSTTTTTTETVIKEIFESTISRTTVSSETISICKSLISYYMKLEQWALAIEVTERSLTLIWKMVISGGGTCALPREFGTEAIDIAIFLAVCHLRSHHYHEAEEIYVRIYRACFNSCHIHDERLTRSSTILIKLYEEHRHWHKMIAIYQELLGEYRKHLGSSHALTIKTLYVLGSLCSEHGHGHYHEYYEEIIIVLNGDSHVCHHGAMDAMTILCRSYYEGGHWHKLRNICVVLWETYIHHHHEHKFEASFIELLYLRYRYVLEHHFHCEYEVLRTLTIQYRDACIKVFGASVAITIKALLEFAHICMRNEKYYHEAISTYEEVLTKTTTTTSTTTTTTTVSTTTTTTIKESLTKAYVVVCSHGSTSTTIIERAIKVLVERFEYLKITLGYARIETLTVLRELVILYRKLKTQESHTIIMRMLLQTTLEIISKEKHSRTLHEAAKLMGSIFVVCELGDYGKEILVEIRRRIITGTSKSGSSLVIKFDKPVGRVTFVYLVTFEEILRGTLTISYSEIMAGLLNEATLYESYTRCIKSQANIEVIMTHGARLRAFLIIHQRKEQVASLDEEIMRMFLKKFESTIQTRVEITSLFVVSLLVEIGRVRRDIEIGDAACISSNTEVLRLLGQDRHQEAYEVAYCAFRFIHHKRAYHHLQNVGHGFKLSAYMAGRNLEKPLKKPVEPKLHKQMLDLSLTIIREVLLACKESNIKFVRMQLGELNDLVGLLGEQQNYADLQWLLSELWSTREGQKRWTSEDIIAIGKRFVQARFLASDPKSSKNSETIPLCEDICYNLRRVKGSLDPLALEMFELLSQIYTTVGHYREAMGVHEDILRLIVEGDDDDDRTIDTVTPQVARQHLDLLKYSYQRLKSWDKSQSVYKSIVDRLIHMKEYKGNKYFEGVQPIEKWNKDEKPGSKGMFVPPQHWEFVDPKHITPKGEVVYHGVPKRPGIGAMRAVSNWGMASMYRLLHGDHEEHEDYEGEDGLPSKKKGKGGDDLTCRMPAPEKSGAYGGYDDGSAKRGKPQVIY